MNCYVPVERSPGAPDPINSSKEGITHTQKKKCSWRYSAWKITKLIIPGGIVAGAIWAAVPPLQTFIAAQINQAQQQLFINIQNWVERIANNTLPRLCHCP